MKMTAQMKYKDVSDVDFANILKKYSENKKGEIAELTNEAADRIFSLVSKIHSFREEDDLK